MLDVVCEFPPELCRIFADAGIPVMNMETLNTFFGEYNLECKSIMDGNTIKPGPLPSTIDGYPTPTTIKPGPVPSTIDDYPTTTTIKPEPVPSTIIDYPTISDAGQTDQFRKYLIKKNEYIVFTFFLYFSV